ncbi:DUF4214 domain-containing protein [Sulfitobacter sp.]|uniref:DUF4214 domain-containing protein n=1 Tax=Sulfitobacter sp. TaxID=1903071 RepID=UPI003EFB3382
MPASLDGDSNNNTLIYNGPLLGKGSVSGSAGDDTITAIAKNGSGGQIHIYAGAGEDTINMDFSDIGSGFSQGHHVRGDNDGGRYNYADTFRFSSVGDIPAGGIVVGRIEDFDASRDFMYIGDTEIHLDEIPLGGAIVAPGINARIVEYNGNHNDPGAAPQQWLLLENANGGRVFYALEGARVDNEGPVGVLGNEQEGHFLRGPINGPLDVPSDFSALVDVVYVDPQNVVPSGHGPVDGRIMNDYDGNRDDVATTVQGSGRDDLIAAGLNDDFVKAMGGHDMVWGGSGNDTILGGSGNDTIDGGQVGAFHLDTHLGAEAATVFRLYQGLLDRNPDPQGFNNWITALEDGMPLLNVVGSFVASQEFQNRYGSLNNGDFVELLYNNVLGRSSDAQGFANWVGALDSGSLSRAEVARGFTQSPEYRNNSDVDFYNYVGKLREENDILTGELGADTFVFQGNFGRDVITDFDPNTDDEAIDLSGVASIVNYGDLVTNHLKQNGGNAVISDAEGNSITLEGVNIADLNQTDFIF